MHYSLYRLATPATRFQISNVYNTVEKQENNDSQNGHRYSSLNIHMSIQRRLNLRHTFPFNPLLYARGEDLQYLQRVFEEQKVSNSFELQALRRRNFWAIQLPTGTFLGEFRPGMADFSADMMAREATLKAIREEYGFRQHDPRRAIVEHHGVLYYHQSLIELLRRRHENPAFLNAVSAFLRAAQQHPELIKGPPPARRAYIPPEQRLTVLGHYARGPEWSPVEDQGLRQWFGKRTVGPHAGQHAKLTEDEWTRVRELFDGRRTVASIRRRISVLNAQLQREMMVNGFIPRDRIREYMDRVLGERPWFPRVNYVRAKRIKKKRRAAAQKLHASLPPA